MYSNRKSFVTGLTILYLLSVVYEYWCIEDLSKQIEDLKYETEHQMTEIEREINDLEEEIDALGDRCDRIGNSLTLFDERVSALEMMATEDTEEQIQDEITEGEIEMLAQLVEAEAGLHREVSRG